jgi:putative hydrolase of the HAD superfamily/pyrimidine and pyridine-specific 5'-nucleotidase
MDTILFGFSVALTTAILTQARKGRRHDDAARFLATGVGADLLLQLQSELEAGTSLNANEKICHVNSENIVIGSALRSEMRLKNLWHRATYILVIHSDFGNEPATPRNDGTMIHDLENTFVLVQKRSKFKDYCPGKLDPLPGGVVGENESYHENAVRELHEEMGIRVESSPSSLVRLFTFPYEDDRVKVFGDIYECIYHGSLHDLIIQKEEVEDVFRLSLQQLKDRIEKHPDDFMPDACHAMKLYFQRMGDIQVKRRLLKGYSSADLDSYRLRPKPKVIFFDCDDCLYFDGWKTANQLTLKIDEWCVNHGLRPGEAYELYKKYGTALRGLLAEGHIPQTEDAIDAFLRDVHDIPVHELLQPDEELREILLRVDPNIPKYIFTASVRDHAERCLEALGIADLFVDIIDCKKCNLETKHSRHSFEAAMHVAGITDPESCLFLDDNLKNITAAREIGWRSVLVGKIGRDDGKEITSEHAELEIDSIHHIPQVLPELFERSESMES